MHQALVSLARPYLASETNQAHEIVDVRYRKGRSQEAIFINKVARVPVTGTIDFHLKVPVTID